MPTVRHVVKRFNYKQWQGVVPPLTFDQDFISNDLWVEDNLVKDLTKRDWRSIIRIGGNATTNMHGVTGITLEGGTGLVEASYVSKNPSVNSPHIWKILTGDLVFLSPSNFSSWLILDYAAARDRSLVDLYSNMAAVEASFKGMVFTGELRESLRMIKSPARSLRRGIGDYLDSLKKRIPRRAPRRRKREILADTWLEYAYGWSPLVNDIDSAIAAFYRSQWVRPVFEMVRGLGYETRTSAGADNVSGLGVQFVQKTTRSEILSVKSYGMYHSQGRGASNSHHSGWTPSEFIPTLWELIPYSFLVDYFTNIGDIISSWSYRWIGLAWAAQTTHHQILVEPAGNVILTPLQPVLNYSIRYRNSIVPWRATKTQFNRVASIPLTIPTLEFEVPGARSLKWLNLLALGTALTSARSHINPPR